MSASPPASALPDVTDAAPTYLGPRGRIFLASVLGLFLELALIRWVSCEIRVFAYAKNLVLVASFLGFGTGCFLSRRRVSLSRALFLLLLLALIVRLPWDVLQQYGPQRVTTVLAQLSGFMIFQHAEAILPWSALTQLAFAVSWTAALFFLVALIMIPFGQITAAGIAQLGRPLAGYSVNVAGSLLGILAYTAATSAGLPPLVWFVPVALGALGLATAAERQAILGISSALCLVLLPNDAPPKTREFWSSYQKLVLLENRYIVVNNTGYQGMNEEPDLTPGRPRPVNGRTIPYLLRYPVGRVLVIGAGSGNDAAAALRGGATSVTAVEIDATIYEIGRALHPQRPYSDPRVKVVIDDARHFLKTSHDQYDLIIFSFLDAHTVLSSFTNVRLDNYIYTVEAFREARARLAPGGLVYVSFFSELPFIGARFDRNLREAFGHPTLALQGVTSSEVGPRFRNVYFLAGEPEAQAAVEPLLPRLAGFERARYDDTIVPSTDDWPFLPLEKRAVPPIILVISGVILALSIVFAWEARPAGEPFDGRLFWLGAAFMLLEVHNVSRLALVFGTTWQVNAWVIGVVLGLILLANAATEALARTGRRAGTWAAIGLFATLAAAYFVPLDVVVGASRATGALLATVLLSLPIFFAGLLFAEAFAKSSSPGFALGWNVLGSVTGGMAESLSYVWGVPALVALAAVFYAAALLWPRPLAFRRGEVAGEA